MRKTFTSKGLYLGKTDSESENRDLLDFFHDYAGVFDDINNGRFIITGRKGAGKSAYAVYLQEKSNIDDSLWCERVKSYEFDLEKIIQNIPDGFIRFEAFYEWIILTKLAKLIIDSELGKYTGEYRALELFYQRNSGLVDIDKYVVAEVLTNQEVNFAPLNSKFGFFSRVFGYKKTKAQFYQMIKPLRETIVSILEKPVYKEASFYVIFDDLDIKFNYNVDSNRTMLMDLIRIAKEYNTDALLRTNARVLLFLRDDIEDCLKGEESDTSKTFVSATSCINWYAMDKNKEDVSDSHLKQFINDRLRFAFEKLHIPYNQEDLWSSFVEPEFSYSNAIRQWKKPSFKAVLDHTFYLPRDVMSIFINIGKLDWKLPLKQDQVYELLFKFSKIKRDEIYDELKYILSSKERDLVFEILRKISIKDGNSYEEVMSIINDCGMPSETFKILVDYSLIVPMDKDSRKYYYNYREQEISDDFENYDYKVHKILYLYFTARNH